MPLSWFLHPIVGDLASALVGGVATLVVKTWTAPYLKAAKARRKCGKRVLDILALCSNLDGTETNPSLQGERDRWIGQLDDATRWLADNWQSYALTYVRILGLGELIAKYGGAARGIWLSSRPLERRVQMIKELTTEVQTIYFAGRLRSARHIPDAAERLRGMLERLTA